MTTQTTDQLLKTISKAIFGVQHGNPSQWDTLEAYVALDKIRTILKAVPEPKGMKSAEEWYAENPSLANIDLGGVIGLIERIQADAVASVRVPDGWQLVPKEPTEEMLNAVAYSPIDYHLDSTQKLHIAAKRSLFAEDYKEALAAAPTPREDV